MKCPACDREIGYHAYEKGPKGTLIPVVTRCPNTGRVVELKHGAESR